jgi:hypothetical protein
VEVLPITQGGDEANGAAMGAARGEIGSPLRGEGSSMQNTTPDARRKTGAGVLPARDERTSSVEEGTGGAREGCEWVRLRRGDLLKLECTADAVSKLRKVRPSGLPCAPCLMMGITSGRFAAIPMEGFLRESASAQQGRRGEGDLTLQTETGTGAGG